MTQNSKPEINFDEIFDLEDQLGGVLAGDVKKQKPAPKKIPPQKPPSKKEG